MEQQLYIFCESDFYLESKTDMICSLDTVGKLLSDPKFLYDHGYRFNSKIHSFKTEQVLKWVGSEQKWDGCYKLIVSYDDCGDIEETNFYLLPLRSFL